MVPFQRGTATLTSRSQLTQRVTSAKARGSARTGRRSGVAEFASTEFGRLGTDGFIAVSHTSAGGEGVTP